MSAPVVALVAVADAPAAITHVVTEDAISVGRGRGCYVAVCGAEVLAASLTAPDGGWCRACRVGGAGQCRG